MSRAEAAVLELKQLVKGTPAEQHVLAWITRHAQVHEARHRLQVEEILSARSPEELFKEVKKTLVEKLVAGLPVEFDSHGGDDQLRPTHVDFLATAVSVQ